MNNEDDNYDVVIIDVGVVWNVLPCEGVRMGFIAIRSEKVKWVISSIKNKGTLRFLGDLHLFLIENKGEPKF